MQYHEWERAVHKRYKNTCQKCGETRTRILAVHHIKNFAQYPELRFDVDNGIIFCRPCHKLFHKIYKKENNSREQVLEFLTGGNI